MVLYVIWMVLLSCMIVTLIAASLYYLAVLIPKWIGHLQMNETYVYDSVDLTRHFISYRKFKKLILHQLWNGEIELHYDDWNSTYYLRDQNKSKFSKDFVSSYSNYIMINKQVYYLITPLNLMLVDWFFTNIHDNPKKYKREIEGVDVKIKNVLV